MQVGFDLTGKETFGIVALRARKTPNPIDLSKVRAYSAENFFEPVEIKGGRIHLEGGQKYLISSRGSLNIPRDLSAELRRHSGQTFRGTLHEAGFIDPGFQGDLVFEVINNEPGETVLHSNDPRVVSSLEFFRTSEEPDKIYGESIGSNYQEQTGPRVSKHFEPFDFRTAAKDYAKLNRSVLVQDVKELHAFRKNKEGFEPLDPRKSEKLLNVVNRGFIHTRYDCEADTLAHQPIPYILLFDDKQRVFRYIKAKNIKDYGDTRLFGKHSIGVGGHISIDDGPNYVENCIDRELREEVKIRGNVTKPRLVGTLACYNEPVDRVHFGLVYKARVSGKIEANEASITSCGMQSFEKLRRDVKPFETWSRTLIPIIEQIYNL